MARTTGKRDTGNNVAESFRSPPFPFDYQTERASFSWESMRRELPELPGNKGFNIAHAAVDHHAQGNRKNHTALRWIGSDDTVRAFTYGELQLLSNRFASILASLGVSKGDTVCTFTGRIPELYIAALGILKSGAVFCPLFPAFGPEPVYQRASRGEAKVLLTTKRLYRERVAQLMDRLPMLRHVLLVDSREDDGKRLLSLPRLMQQASDTFTIPPTGAEDMALLHFTSGTSGMPKGAIHVHDAALVHYMTGKYVMGFHPDDIFWCTADPGWVTGTSYGFLSPFLHGITCIVDEGDFDASRWCSILESQLVSVWYTAPTAIRRLMRLGAAPADTHDLKRLRLVCSVGEPLNPEAVIWGEKALGMPIHDTWWQTETGGIMIANPSAMEIRPGSMGRPVPGIEAALVRRDEQNGVQRVKAAGTVGELALKTGWPSMFRGYLHDEERYRRCFAGEWYLTGDLARQDEDGYFWFIGRADDIIKTAGHLVGPFEVESTLMEHPAVAEAAVIGKPNPLTGELVKAFVALKSGIAASEELQLEIISFARKRLGPAIAPRELEFQPSLPKNRSGKIMRRLLRTRELGLPEDDLSTLEDG